MLEQVRKLLKDHNKLVGANQVKKAISDGTVRCVIVALDCDYGLRQSLISLAEKKGLDVIYVPHKAELGSVCGIEVDASVVALY